MKNLMEEMMADLEAIGKSIEAGVEIQDKTAVIKNEKGKNENISIEEKEDLTSIESWGSILKKIIVKIKQKVCSNNFIKKILPTEDEIPKTMAKMIEEGKYHKIVNDGIKESNYGVDKLKNAMQSDRYSSEQFIKNVGLSDDEAKTIQKLINDINPSNASKTIEAMKKIQPDNEKYQKIVSISERRINRLGNDYATVDPKNAKWIMNPINYYANIPKAYFNNPDPNIATTRKTTAVAGSVSILIGIIYIFNLITKILLFLIKKKAF